MRNDGWHSRAPMTKTNRPPSCCPRDSARRSQAHPAQALGIRDSASMNGCKSCAEHGRHQSAVVRGETIGRPSRCPARPGPPDRRKCQLEVSAEHFDEHGIARLMEGDDLLRGHAEKFLAIALRRVGSGEPQSHQAMRDDLGRGQGQAVGVPDDVGDGMSTTRRHVCFLA